jgi:acylphosphatase
MKLIDLSHRLEMGKGNLQMIYKSIRVKITGKVQGIGYRNWAVAEANIRNIGGVIMNCSDGTVEVILEGTHNMVDQMMDRLREGPPLSKVETVEVISEKEVDKVGNFSVKRD